MDPQQPLSHDGGSRLPALRTTAVTPPVVHREIVEPPRDLGTVVRDAINEVTEIARDAVSLVRLEAKRTASMLASRVAWGAVAIVSALVGTVLLFIAIFIGLGFFIPSVGWRLFIFAVGFLGFAVVGALMARKGQAMKQGVAVPEVRREEPKRFITPVRPVEGIGE